MVVTDNQPEVPMGPNLEFVVNQRLIAAYAIRHNGTKCAEFITALRVAAQRLNSRTYQFIRYPKHTAFADSLAEQGKEADIYLGRVTDLPEFRAVLENTQKARDQVVEEWERVRVRTSKEMADILGRNMVGDWRVYITPPSLGAGTNTGEGITWTYRDDWPHYNAVYLWHEILHSEFGETELEHAVIELATDNELRVRLNGGEYPPWEGHPHLHSLRKRLLGSWRKYLRSPSDNIYDFVHAAAA